MTATAGRKLELFGNPGIPGTGGTFLAPAGTPYRQIAIPPSNLDTFSSDFPFNYHLYVVCKDFQSEEGRIAPWFQQPGGGIQDFTGNQQPPFDTVGDLTNAKYIQDITYLPTTTTCSQ